jgi:hypothetical protein
MCDSEYRMQSLISMNSVPKARTDKFTSSILCRDIERNISDVSVVLCMRCPKILLSFFGAF